jgi:hypothetical protein
MMFYNEKHERNRNIFPSTAIVFLYFFETIHRTAMTEQKPKRNITQRIVEQPRLWAKTG